MKNALVVIACCLLLAPPAAARENVAGPLRAEVLRVVDGDTLDVRLKVWIGTEVTARVRIDGIDAPEMRGKCDAERLRARAAKAELERLVAEGGVTLTDIRNGKYAGRVLAHARAADGTDIASHMLGGDFARAYGGGKRTAWCAG